MRVTGRQSNGLGEVLESSIQRALKQVQLTPVLEGLPQSRAETEGFGQNGNGFSGPSRRGQTDGLIQQNGGIGNGGTPAAEETEIRAEDQTEARQCGRALELPDAQEEPAGHRQAAEETR